MNSTSSSINRKRLPESFGRYEVRSLLGEGAMGRVYLAVDPVLDRQVAIKVITINAQTEQKTREEYLGRFNVEARAGARLNHPSIVTIFDAGDQDGVPWIAFEYILGEPLQHLLEKQEPISLEKALAVMLDITAALHHAHESGIIHRDVKPANILIDKRTGIAKLADFGVVKAPWVALTQDGSTVGSPGYMAPEQLDGRGSDARSDLFSLGIVLYQMLTGKHPFLRPSIPATILATINGKYTPITELSPDCPPYLTTIVTTLLQSDPTKRYQTAAMLLHELRLGSRPAKNTPEFDKNAFLGNTTRMHRISHALKQQLLKKKSPPPFATVMKSIPEKIHAAAQHFTDRYAEHATLWNAGLGILIAVLLIGSLFIARTSDERTALHALKREGFHGTINGIIDSCNALIACSTYTPVRNVVRLLGATSRYAASAYLLGTRTALNDDDDDAATDALRHGISCKDWRQTRTQYLDVLVTDCTRRLSLKKADTALTDMLADAVLYDQKDLVTGWMTQEAYWLRWNGVRIAGRLSVPVDSVTVYMLDLAHAGSVSTRKKAATRLGELGDTVAIPALERAADLGFRDPIVSYTANQVLRNYFKQK